MAEKLITPVGTFSFANVAAPRPQKNGPPKYECTLVFPKNATGKEKARIDALRAQAEEVAKDKLGAKADAKIASWKARNPAWPFRDGAEKQHLAGYTDKVLFLRASADRKPVCVDNGRNEILDIEGEVYSGAIGRLNVNAFYFNIDGNEGISWGLNAVKKVKDGERIGGVSADTAFDGAEDDEDGDDLL